METKHNAEGAPIVPEAVLVGVCSNLLKLSKKIEWAANRSEAMSLDPASDVLSRALGLQATLQEALKVLLTEEEYLQFVSSEQVEEV